MTIKNFTSEYIKAVEALAAENYAEERAAVPSLPLTPIPSLADFAENDNGAAAFGDNGELLGYLCAWGPFDGAFDTPAKGMYSPCYAHGAVKENRSKILRRLYQYAAEKWVKAGAYSHAITLYAHDEEAINAFFINGFGLRCMDLMRGLDSIYAPEDKNIFEFERKNISYRPLTNAEIPLLRPMRRALSDHLGKSPCFMVSSDDDYNSWLIRAEKRDTKLYAAFNGDIPVAFVEISDEGESFAANCEGTANICGAYCLPEYRGGGLFASLLNFTVEALKESGAKRLGVDCESINPNAYGFWTKYFDAYTYSVVRRIDEISL